MTGSLRDVIPPKSTNRGGRLRRLWWRDSTAVTAALLNASGVGLGYAYLRRWRHVAVYWVGLLVWLWLASSTVFWLLVIVAWVGAAVVLAFRAGTSVDHRLARPPHPWRPAAAGVAFLVLAAGLVIDHRASAHQALDAGDKAHARGDCEDAIGHYDRVSHDHNLSFTAALDRAADHRRVCRLLLAARRSAADGSFTAAISDYELYLGNDGAPFLDGADAELATVRSGYAVSLADEGDADGLQAAYDQYVVVVDEHPDSPEAASAPDDVAAMYEAATADLTEGRHCDAIGNLDLFASLPGDDGLSDAVVAQAQQSLPVATLGCGSARLDADNFDTAERMLDRVVADVPGTPLAEEAAALLVVLAAEREQQQIRDEIADLGTDSGELAPPTPSGSAPGGVVTVEVVNGSPRALELLYSGPETGRLALEACADCVERSVFVPSTPLFPDVDTCGTPSSPRRTVTLPAGTYDVAVKATDGEGAVTPFSGSWTLASGTAYSDCYYIESSPF